jgi:hypothetical protein
MKLRGPMDRGWILATIDPERLSPALDGSKSARISMSVSHDHSGSSVSLLNYESLILDELLEEDTLCILSAGLGWHKVR